MTSTFDAFFVTYDEPEKERRWQEVSSLIPNIHWIDGIKGFDQSIKVCAEQSKTDRFFVIDGDNQVLPEFLKYKYNLSDVEDEWILSFASRNNINGLVYGNGGIKCWPQAVAQNMKTHERASAEAATTDFCFQLSYLQVPLMPSVTVINSSPYQAFRAGYREGVKMCLENGTHWQNSSNTRTMISTLNEQNLTRLRIWGSVGTDQPNGLWAIYGARLGCYHVNQEGWDYHLINDYEKMAKLWTQEIWPLFERYPANSSPSDGTSSYEEKALTEHCKKLGKILNQRFDLGLHIMDPRESQQFKRHFKNPVRRGLMMDAQRDIKDVVYL